MKKVVLLALIPLFSLMVTAQSRITLSVGNRSVTAVLTGNEATRKLISLLSEGPITVDMSDYGGFEKVGELPQPLPTSNSQITTGSGDIMLYQGRNIVIFYGSNSWSYTRLGRIEGLSSSALREFLGNGNISLTISLSSEAGIDTIEAANSTATTVHNLSGNLITTRPLPPGIYIIDGKKRLVR